MIQKSLIAILDFFYPLVKPFGFDKRTYHYLVCGGGNTALGLIIFYIGFNFIFHRLNLDLGFIVIRPYVAAMCLSIIVTFPIGFLLNRFIVWSDSTLSPWIQLYRHFVLVLVFSSMNYILLKFFVEYLGWWVDPSQFLTTCIIVVFSYLSQKYFSFKKAKVKE